jgi:hypothetical protein
MFWKFVIAIAVGIGLMQLGALSVWVGILSVSLKVILALVVLAGLSAAGIVLWRRSKSPEGPIDSAGDMLNQRHSRRRLL